MAAPAPAAADVEPSPFFDELPVVLSASRLVQSPLDAPAPVTIIDREMIEASGFTEIHDLLRLVPGFLVADWPDGSPTVANHGLGDAHGRRIKVLIDGRTVNSPLWGDTNWHDLPIRVDDIDHIEVVRGPHGATYGANAFQGVVHIFTRSPLTEEGAAVIARVGADGFYDGGGRINSRPGSPVDWRLSASTRAADTFQSFEDGPIESIRRDVMNFQAATQASSQDEFRLHLGAVQGSDHRGYPKMTPQADSRLRTDTARGYYLHLAWQRTFDAESELTLKYNHQSNAQRSDWQVETPDRVLPVDFDVDIDSDDLELQLSQRLAPTLHLLWGAAMRRDAVRSQRYFDTGDAVVGFQWQTFASLTWNPVPKLGINAGGVFERHHYSGTLFSPRLAANYALTPLSSVRVSTGIAYRTPSFMEAYSKETIRENGEIIRVLYHAALPVDPEMVRHTELGYVARFPQIGVDLDTRIFHERYSRYLDDQSCRHRRGSRLECPFPPPAGFSSNPLSPTTFYFVNSGAFTMEGFETSINWHRPGWGRVVASQAFIDVRANGDVPDPDIENSAPSAMTSLLFIKELPWLWKMSLGYYHNQPMFWLNDGDRVPHRDRVDLRLARGFGAPGSDNELAFVVQSVGGRYPEFHEGRYRAEPRAYASVRMSW